MNNEPVAWIAYDEFGDFMLEATPEGDYPWIPLYTHPAKTPMLVLDGNRVYPANAWQGLTAEEIATIPNDEFRLQKVEKILKDRNTHPTKTLTDEEIMKTCIKHGIYDCISDSYIKDDGTNSLDEDLIRFARAILRKAQE